MLPPLPNDWANLLENEIHWESFQALDRFLESELESGITVLPERNKIFRAFDFTPFEKVRVVLLGQDPYPTPGHAHGLCFSVQPGVRPIPGSLRNIYKELRDDVGFQIPNHGCLEAWARRGVLLLNTVLTVRSGEANSHAHCGWERFTDAVMARLNARSRRVVFLLWGRHAQKKRLLITGKQHRVIEAAHPSPLSARLFLGCRCFSAVNRHLLDAGMETIDWQLDEV